MCYLIVVFCCHNLNFNHKYGVPAFLQTNFKLFVYNENGLEISSKVSIESTRTSNTAMNLCSVINLFIITANVGLGLGYIGVFEQVKLVLNRTCVAQISNCVQKQNEHNLNYRMDILICFTLL